MKISAKCITYGRTALLEEALHSFLIQDYDGEKELIIVNDYPLQTLHFDHPEVKIYNLQETFPTIGEKENYALSKCTGDVIAVWDDDDVALPHHMTNIRDWMKDNDLLFWEKGVYFGHKAIQAITGLGNSGIVYTKRAWEAIGGHPLENAGYDNTLVQSIMRHSKKVVNAKPEIPSWFYMWGDRSYHMSGLGTDDGTRPNAIQRHSEHIENERKLGNIPTGDVYLQPHWNQDYSQLLKEYMK